MTPAATPAENFARLIAGLCRAVAAAAAKNPLAAPLLILLWPRLNRLARRFAALVARVEAGTARPRPASPRPAAARPRRPCARLPRRFAWLVRLVPEAASAGSQLQYFLATPESAALLAAAPQAGRLLRPFCRMLGVRPPPALTLPPRPTRPRTAPSRPAAGRASSAAPPPDPPRPRAVPARRADPRACGPPGAA